MNRLVRLPAQQAPDVSHLPLATLSAFVLISAIVAGVAEESGFRCYMQCGLEQRHGPVVAILVTGGIARIREFFASREKARAPRSKETVVGALEIVRRNGGGYHGSATENGT